MQIKQHSLPLDYRRTADISTEWLTNILWMNKENWIVKIE